MGELALVGDHSTVPLTRVSCNTIFSKSQIACKLGTLCTGARTSWVIPGVYPVTGPELEKIANVVFMDLLKSNKKFYAKLKKISREKTTENPPDTGKIFRKHITSFSNFSCRFLNPNNFFQFEL